MTLLKLEYDYHVSATTENNGNPRVQRIDDGVTTRTQNYGFDAANRVSSMAETGGASLTFNYDAYNNRWVTVPGGSPGHAAATVSAQSAYNAATNRFVTAAMSEDYDVAGHTTVMEGGVITSDWDSEGNRIKSTNQSYTPTYYVFDGLGQRVKKENEYWGTYVHVYDAFGRLAAEYGAGANGECTTCYPIEDTVGSTRLVANENGDAVQRFDYTPFGPELTAYDGTWANGRAGTAWDSSTIVLQQYAGMYRDVLGLEGSGDFVGARVFKRSLGRFWSPDENLTDQDAADPLSWNLYTYARNNPLIYIDPTGRCSKAADGNGYVDDGEGLFKGRCADGVIGETPMKNPNSATVNEIAPPSPWLLAVARGAQRAEPAVNAAAIGTGAVVGAAFAAAAYGAFVGGEIGVLGLEMLPSQARNIKLIQNALRDHVQMKDLAGAAKETAGFTIRTGTKIWNHRQELIETARNLRGAVRALKGSLNDPSHGGATRQLVQQAIQKGETALRRIDAALGR